jgi:ABC-2 type transport system ATP-binding protein
MGKIKTLNTPASLKSSLGNELIEFQFSTIDNNEINAALVKIGGLDFVKSVSDAGNRGYMASVNNGEASIPALFESLKESPVKISHILFRQPSLDDVFLHYTGREIRDAGGGKENAARNRIRMRRTRK